MSGRSIKRVAFYCKQMSRFIFSHFTFQKNLKTFIIEYVTDVRFIIS